MSSLPNGYPHQARFKDQTASVEELPSDVQDRIREWSKFEVELAVLEDAPETFVDYLRQLATVPGIEESVRQFDAHPYEVRYLDGLDNELRYALELPDPPGWRFYCEDRRHAAEGYDFELRFSPPGDFWEVDTHVVTVMNGYLCDWGIERGAEMRDTILSGTGETLPEASAADSHRLVCERARLHDVVVEFFEAFDGYDLHEEEIAGLPVRPDPEGE